MSVGRLILKSGVASIILICIVAGSALGAPLENVPIELEQPDGTVLNLFATGDEFYNWVHDKNGYTIVRNQETGWLEYATATDGVLTPSGYIVGEVDPASVGLRPYLNHSAAYMQELRLVTQDQFWGTDPVQGMTRSYAPHTGLINNIAIFIRFSDEDEFTDPIATYDTAFNDSTANAVSMTNYFKEASYNSLTTDTTFYPTAAPGVTTVVSYQDTHPRAHYKPYDLTTNPDGYQDISERMAREHLLLKNAVDAISADVDPSLVVDGDGDGYVDNVAFIIKGDPTAWSTLLWPHMWSLHSQTAEINGKRVIDYNLQLQSMFNVSVLCHEMGHSLGAPDLYRYTDTTITPVGIWDIMARTVTPPQHMGAQTKLRYMGWISSCPQITTPGTYTLNPIVSATNNCYTIPSPYSAAEHFVIEYRRKTGTFEVSVPGSGLLVARINPSLGGNAFGPPDEIYYYRPGGTTTVNGNDADAYFSSDMGRTVINDTTDPSGFLSDGSAGGLDICDVGAPGDTISFRLGCNVPVAPEIDIQRPIAVSLADGATNNLGSGQAGRVSLIYIIDNSAGTAQLDVTGVTASSYVNSSEFSVDTALPLNIAAGSTVNLDVSFSVDTPGAFSLDMHIANNDADENPYDLTIAGATGVLDGDGLPASYGLAWHVPSNRLQIGDDSTLDDSATFTPIDSDGTYSVDVDVSNTSGQAAQLVGWIDFDTSGTFEESERSSPALRETLPIGCPSIGATDIFFDTGNIINGCAGIVTLQWTVANPQPIDTYARIRLTTDPVFFSDTSPEPSGTYGPGETEGHTVPGKPLPVTLGYFYSEQKNGEVHITWQTATETGTAGFNVLAVHNEGERKQLNGEIIPSSVVDSVTPSDYDFSAATEAAVFYLDAVNINGSVDSHGPFTIDEAYGARDEPSGTDGGRHSVYLPFLSLP